MEQHVVSGIAYARDEAKVTLLKVADKPGVAAGVFGPLAAANINVDMIVQNVSEAGFTDITFTVQSADYDRAVEVLQKAKETIGYFDLRGATDVAKVSAIGVGMRSHAGVAAQMFSALAEKGINIEAISTSEIKISVLIDAAYAELAVRTLHSSVRIGQPLKRSSGSTRPLASLVRRLRRGEERLCQFLLAPRDCCYAACAR